jgi:hypothetical protein
MIHGKFTFKAIIKTLIDIADGKVEDASDDGLSWPRPWTIQHWGWARWSIPKMADQRDAHEYNSLSLPWIEEWQIDTEFQHLILWIGTHLIIIITVKRWWEMESRLRGHARFDESFLEIIQQVRSPSKKQ